MSTVPTKHPAQMERYGDGLQTVCTPHHKPIPPPHQSGGSSGLCPKPSARTTSQQCPTDKDRTDLHREPVQPMQTLILIDAEHQTCMLHGPRRKHQQCLQGVKRPKHTGMARGNVSTRHTRSTEHDLRSAYPSGPGSKQPHLP
jgi:hypothetical protein